MVFILIQKSYKLRFYPSVYQEILLTKTFGCVRFIWNDRVARFNNWTVSEAPELPELTIKEMKVIYPWLSEVPYNALEQKLQDWRATKSQYFNKKRKKKLGRPKFKKRGGRQSFRLSYGGFSFRNNLINVYKLGELNLVGHDLSSMPMDTCKQITISRDPSGKFYCSILVQEQPKPKPLTGKTVGIDLGIKDLFILSDGTAVNNPKWFRENQSKLKVAQQHLSRKQKGSNRRGKQKIKVARCHEKIRFKRNNFLHEISSAIVRDFDVICIEDLNVAGMIKNHHLSKSIADASWSSFTTMLEYKCNWYGKTLVKIDRFYPSSKTCSCCGHKMDSMDLSIREWTCPSCDEVHNRDINAAKNILAKGMSDLCGEPIKFAGLHKPASVESVDYRHREALVNGDVAASEKCLEFV